MNAAEDAIHVIIPIFCVATMFAMGLDVTLAEAVAPLRQKLALGITVLVNNVLIPLLGFLVIALPALLAADWLANMGLEDLALTGGAQMGFLLLMLASGSLLGPTLARIAGANEATAKGVMVMLAVASAVLVPVELQLLCSSKAVSACSDLSGSRMPAPCSCCCLLLQVAAAGRGYRHQGSLRCCGRAAAAADHAADGADAAGAAGFACHVQV